MFHAHSQMPKLITLTSFLLSLLLHATPVPAISNPSFEETSGEHVAGWSFWNWARKGQKASHRGSWDPEVAHSAKASLRITGTATGQVGCWDNKHAKSLIPIQPGATYEMSFWLKLETPKGGGYVDRASISFYTAAKEPLPESAKKIAGKLSGTFDWKRIAILAPAPENAAFARIDLAFTGVGSAWFDSLALLPVSKLSETNPTDQPPFLRARLATRAPLIDGKDAEGFWGKALHSHPFLLADNSAYPEENTQLAVATDSTTLYLQIQCSETLLDPVQQRTHEVVAKARKRDGPVQQDDHVEILIAGTGQNAGCARILLNPLGTTYDAWETGGKENIAWSYGGTAVATTEKTRWTAELAIPFQSLGGKPEAGANLQMNVRHHRSATREISAWAAGDAFGTIAFGAPSIGLSNQSPLLFEEGRKNWQFQLQSEIPLTATTLLRYSDFPPSTETKILAAQAEKGKIHVPYSVQLKNTAILLSAPVTADHRTLCFRSNKLPIRGNQLHRFLVRVKTEDVVGGKGRPISLAISSYDQNGKLIKGYEILTSIAPGSKDWHLIETTWTPPPLATDILFWGIKWKGTGASGNVWFDDFSLCPLGNAQNVFINGSLETNGEGVVNDWNLFSGAKQADSYERGKQATAVGELRTMDDTLLLRTPPIPGTVSKRITAIDASLLLKAGMKDSDNVFRFKELYVTEGGILPLPIALRSSFAKRYDWADLLLDVPAFLHLQNPFPRAQLLESSRNANRRYYRIRFDKDMISPDESDRYTLKVGILLLECDAIQQEKDPFDIHIGSAIEGIQGEDKTLPLHVLPPLQGRRPEIALIKHWACGSFYRDFRKMNPQERNCLARYWKQAGFNRTGGALAAGLRERYGFSARGHIPLITADANVFPGGMEYLAEHPEAHALQFDGKKRKNTFCPTYFLSDANSHLGEARQWLAEEARKYPHLDWDYEVPVVRDTSICVCKRCLKAFCHDQKLPTDGTVDRTNLLSSHRSAWIDWRCRENARIAEFFRNAIKEANPNCLFSIYSGYQGKTDEKYGVDWRYMSRPADLVWAGYGRPVQAIQATHAAIDGKPFICGVLAWFGSRPWNNANAQTTLFRRLTDGGSGIMAYFNWIVDGRFYRAVNRVASIVSDYEPFFRWDITGDGTYRNRYQRADGLVKVTDGEATDVAVLTHGNERLVFAFNHTKEERVPTLSHQQWQAGMVCLDAETREPQEQTHRVVLPPHEVRIFHLRETRETTIHAPKLISGFSNESLRQPVLSWQGIGQYPGDQLFELQISRNPEFPPENSLRLPRLERCVYLPIDSPPGVTLHWRVRAQDVPSGKTSPWSETGKFTRSFFSELPNCPPAFSPNADGVLDTITIKAELGSSMPWTVHILDDKEKMVKSISGSGDQISATWKGKDDQGHSLPEGSYRYLVIPGEKTELAVSGQVELNQRVGLVNPSFRHCNGFILTTPTGSATCSKDYTVSQGNSYSIRLKGSKTKTNAYWSNYATGGIGGSVIPVTPGSDFRFAAHIRTELSEGEAFIALAFFTDDGHWAEVEGQPPSGVSSAPLTGTTDWEKREIVLKTPANAHSAVLFFRLKDAHGNAWFDAVEAETLE